MRVLDENLLLLSATDLVYFLGCHATVEVPEEGFDPSREKRSIQEVMRHWGRIGLFRWVGEAFCNG